MVESFMLDRRRLLERALLLVGAGASLSACDMLSGPSADSPYRYSAEQMAVISAAANIIVPSTETPGALDAGVPDLFESLMADWASSETRDTVAGAIAAIDALAPGGRSFAALDDAEQATLLKAHDKTSLALGPAAGSPLPVDPAYAQFKDIILTLYYYSEPALTQELDYIHVPGRWDPSIPVTPDTRPSGAPSMY